MVCFQLILFAAEQMDQISILSGLGSGDITDESTSLVDVRWSSEEDEVKNYQLGTKLYQHEATAACTWHSVEWIHIKSNHAVLLWSIMKCEAENPWLPSCGSCSLHRATPHTDGTAGASLMQSPEGSLCCLSSAQTQRKCFLLTY